ncbi:Flagellin [compost metagenome]
MRELAVQASNGTLTNSDRGSVDAEFQALKSEIDNITSYTSFNGQTLLSAVATFTFQVGANQNQTLVFTTQAVTTGGLTLGATVATTTQAAAQASITSVDNAIAAVSAIRSRFGATSNRLEYTINNTAIARENLSAAESRIRDVDMAQEMTNLTRRQILMQSGTAMLSQANMQPQAVLGLLR